MKVNHVEFMKNTAKKYELEEKKRERVGELVRDREGFKGQSEHDQLKRTGVVLDIAIIILEIELLQLCVCACERILFIITNTYTYMHTCID